MSRKNRINSQMHLFKMHAAAPLKMLKAKIIAEYTREVDEKRQE